MCLYLYLILFHNVIRLVLSILQLLLVVIHIFFELLDIRAYLRELWNQLLIFLLNDICVSFIVRLLQLSNGFVAEASATLDRVFEYIEMLKFIALLQTFGKAPNNSLAVLLLPLFVLVCELWIQVHKIDVKVVLLSSDTQFAAAPRL